MTEITNGHKVEKHLCEQCAAAEGIPFKSSVPISQLLEDFIKQAGTEDDPACDVCGRKFSEFHQQGLLGCQNDYEAFGKQLLPILQRAQEGATQHVGKVPHQAAGEQKKQMAILRLRAQLRNAVSQEDYERAASLRDQIKELENA